MSGAKVDQESIKNCRKNLKIAVFQIFANFLNFLNHFWLVSEGFAGPKNEGSGSKKPIKTYGFLVKSLLQVGVDFRQKSFKNGIEAQIAPKNSPKS